MESVPLDFEFAFHVILVFHLVSQLNTCRIDVPCIIGLQFESVAFGVFTSCQDSTACSTYRLEQQSNSERTVCVADYVGLRTVYVADYDGLLLSWDTLLLFL